MWQGPIGIISLCVYLCLHSLQETQDTWTTTHPLYFNPLYAFFPPRYHISSLSRFWNLFTVALWTEMESLFSSEILKSVASCPKVLAASGSHRAGSSPRDALCLQPLGRAGFPCHLLLWGLWWGKGIPQLWAPFPKPLSPVFLKTPRLDFQFPGSDPHPPRCCLCLPLPVRSSHFLMVLFCPTVTFSTAPVIILNVSRSTRVILPGSWPICPSASYPGITSACPQPLTRVPTPQALQLPQLHHLSGRHPQTFWLALFFWFQYFFTLSHWDLHNTVSIVTVHLSQFFFPALVRFSWRIALCKCKVYNVLIWYIYILQNDSHHSMS